MISGCGRSAGAVIPALGSGRYSPGPYIVLPSWLKDSDPNCTLNVFWGQPGALATVSICLRFFWVPIGGTRRTRMTRRTRRRGCLARRWGLHAPEDKVFAIFPRFHQTQAMD